MSRPNILVIVTDQQRAPMHWPDEPGWLEELAPNDAELRRTGVSFTHACTATAMCSPSRASFLTGTYPSRHGVTLTLTEGDLYPNPRNAPASLGAGARMAARGELPRGRFAKAAVRGILRMGAKGGDEPELPAGIATLGSRLQAAGYAVGYKGKWHLSKPVAGHDAWGPADVERLERDYGFPGWEPPDAGENVDPEGFGGGTAGRSGQGWDEDYTRQAERFLAAGDLPEPFCLIVSLVNPHDVLGYPASYAGGGYARAAFAGLPVELPRTIDEDLRDKPTVHAMLKFGQTSYLGALRSEAERLDYVRFYAYLQAQVDRQIGRLVAALGDPGDPGSLRSRTVITRFSDHGELGLSHGGLRQKMFNAYEESIRVPLVISNPLLFGQGAESATAASLVDVVPTLLDVAGAPRDGTLDGASLAGVLAANARPEAEAVRVSGTDFGGVLDAAPQTTVREHALFTYDDHQAGTAYQDTLGQPNRIRCVRGGRWKYAAYVDPTGREAPEYELYDLEADPDEAVNLVEKSSGRGRTATARVALPELREALRDACASTEMDRLVALPAVPA